MHVQVLDHGSGDRPELILGRRRHTCGLSEHDLRDIEFALAQRRAMSKRCPAVSGEHTCGLAPGHASGGQARLRLGDTPDGWRTVPGGPAVITVHLCRACPEKWEDEKET